MLHHIFRIQQQKIIHGKPEYSGIVDVATSMIKIEGMTALWKGWPFYYCRIAPATVLFFVFIEQLKEGYRKYIMNEPAQ